MSVTQPGPAEDGEEQGETSPWEQHPDKDKPVSPHPAEEEPTDLLEAYEYQFPTKQLLSRYDPNGFCREHKRTE